MDITEIFGDASSKDGAGKGKVGYLQKLVGINGTETSTGPCLVIRDVNLPADFFRTQ